MRILIAEDDAPLASFISKALMTESHSIEIACDGEQALQKLVEVSCDLLILDLNLPVIDGTEVLNKVRTMDSSLPILILTASDSVAERVACLDAGADDYLTKPFSLSELSARIRALLRRRSRPVQTQLRIEDLVLDCVARTVHRSGKKIELTPKEFSLLEYFMRNPGRRITRNMIVEHVWKMSPGTLTNVADVYVNYLRRKIDEGSSVKLIRTIRGVGYEFGPRSDVVGSAKGA